MARGTKKGRVHAVFTARTDELRTQADEQATAFSGSGARPWQVPEPLADKDLLDVPKLHDPAFERTEINANYDEAVQDPKSPGTNGDAMSLKMQADVLAVQERAFRLRHASPIRCLVVAMGRRKGHGHAQGVHDAVRREAENLLQAGAS